MSFINKSDELVQQHYAKKNRKDAEKKTDEKDSSIALMISFSPEFRLEFDIKSLIGSRAKLENIPRLKSIIENVLRNWFVERCIEPSFQLINLPVLWSSKKNSVTTNSTAGSGSATEEEDN
ncbi:unnamed protein product [Ambrosiozyma monospora]|uniref:Unnamed protein product n=1 Tax=Ambrosiozyma monospora TaxID=43982 RepID=A0A9W6Z8H8_AMBMO|nr:unnamed protein product [Ambrosiozyma monospora]